MGFSTEHNLKIGMFHYWLITIKQREIYILGSGTSIEILNKTSGTEGRLKFLLEISTAQRDYNINRTDCWLDVILDKEVVTSVFQIQHLYINIGSRNTDHSSAIPHNVASLYQHVQSKGFWMKFDYSTHPALRKDFVCWILAENLKGPISIVTKQILTFQGTLHTLLCSKCKNRNGLTDSWIVFLRHLNW